MQYEEHGGGCCGVTHISGFYYDAAREERGLRDSIAEVENEYKYDNEWYVKGSTDEDGYGGELLAKRFNRVFEVILTDDQLSGDRGQQRADLLKRNGFRLVTRFLNDNSGNVCNIFHRSKRISRLTSKLPFKW